MAQPNKQAATDILKTWTTIGRDPSSWIHYRIRECEQILANEKSPLWIKRMENALSTYRYALDLWEQHKQAM